MYQLQSEFMGRAATCVKRVADNAYIFFDPTSTDYAEYLKWLDKGNTPLPADEENT